MELPSPGVPATPWIAAMRIGVLILADAADYLDYKGVKFATTARGIACWFA